MKCFINEKLGSLRLINYTGEIKYFGDELAEAAKNDPLLAQQVFAAFNELQVYQKSCVKGEELIDLLLNHHS